VKKIILLLLLNIVTLLSIGQTSKAFNSYFYIPSSDLYTQDFAGSNGCNNGPAVYLYGSAYSEACCSFSNYYYLVKTDTDGAFKWGELLGPNFTYSTYNGNGTAHINPDTYDQATSPYGMVLTGEDLNSFPVDRANFTQIDSSGAILFSLDLYLQGSGTWSGVGFGGANQFSAGNDVKSTPGKNFYLIGTVYPIDDGYSNPTGINGVAYQPTAGPSQYDPGQDILIAKINKTATNDTVFTKTIGLVYTGLAYGFLNVDSTRNEYPSDFYYDKPSNGLYIIGTTETFYDLNAWSRPRSQIFIMKTDTFGNPQWVTNVYVGSGTDGGYQSGIGGGAEWAGGITKVPGSTDYMVVGALGSNGYGIEGGIILIRITNTGSVVWVHQIWYGGSSWGYTITPTSDNNLLIGASVMDAQSGGGTSDMAILVVNPAGFYVNGTQVGTAGQQDGWDDGNWWGPRAVQIGTGSYAIMGETYEPNSTAGAAMFTKVQRSGPNSFSINSPCAVTQSVVPTVTDISPASAANPKAQVRQWNGVTSINNPGLNPRVGGYYYGYSIPIAVSTLNMGVTNISTINLSSFTTATTTCALPISLLSFTGILENGIVELNWSTASEVNNKYFTIDRSTDGVNWQTIANVNGAGNSDVNRYYTTYDDNPIVGVDYYRLTQTDYDGNSKTFDPIAVEISSSQSIRVYPTLATDVINVQGDVARIIILNELGQQMAEQNVTENKTSISLGGYPMGVYVAEVFDKQGNMTTSRFLKQ
jgi:hypothetical protein